MNEQEHKSHGKQYKDERAHNGRTEGALAVFAQGGYQAPGSSGIVAGLLYKIFVNTIVGLTRILTVELINCLSCQVLLVATNELVECSSTLFVLVTVVRRKIQRCGK